MLSRPDALRSATARSRPALLAAAAGAALFLSALAALAAAREPGGAREWVAISDQLTSSVEPEWPGLTAGVAVDPASGDVYLVISGLGVWKSSDRGRSFAKVDGGNVSGRCETGAAISVDPRGGGRLAFFMLDGKSAWTPDGGKTWRPCSDKSRGFDFVAVDWSDPGARRMFGVRHESGDVGLISDDAGATWRELEKGFKGFGVFDFDTLVTTRGKGIERSTDGGVSWKKVSDVTPTGRLMELRGGAGYWLCDKGILVSRDEGASWSRIEAPADAWFGPYFGEDPKHMVIVGKTGLHETKDGGARWSLAAPAPAVKDFHGPWYPNYAWDAKADVFYASRMGKPAFRFER